MYSYQLPEFIIERREDRCIKCGVCERQCAFEVHHYDEELDMMFSDESKCVGCQRCMAFCHTDSVIK